MIPAIIPCRSGSKSVPNKNMRTVKGRPLLEYAVRAAALSTKIDRVFISSDSREYIDFALKVSRFHAPDKSRAGIVRPPHLAEDVPTEDVILHALSKIEEMGERVEGPVVTLQCTTPLMMPEDIDNAIMKYKGSPFNSVISVTNVRDYPNWMFNIMANGEMTPFLKEVPDGELGVRQNLPVLVRPNGAIYVTSAASLKTQKTLFAKPVAPYWMPWERSWDVDEEIDLKILEILAP